MSGSHEQGIQGYAIVHNPATSGQRVIEFGVPHPHTLDRQVDLALRIKGALMLTGVQVGALFEGGPAVPMQFVVQPDISGYSLQFLSDVLSAEGLGLAVTRPGGLIRDIIPPSPL